MKSYSNHFGSKYTKVSFNLDEIEPKLKYQCSKCVDYFESRRELNRHFTMHTCYVTLSKVTIKSMKQNALEKQFDTVHCSKCVKYFESRTELNRHLIIYHNVKIKSVEQFKPVEMKNKPEFKKFEKCTKCPGLFETQDDLEQHFAQVHGGIFVTRT